MQKEDLSKLYDICKALRELRKAQHKTQKEVAEALGITPQSYQAYESGKTLPTLENRTSRAKPCPRLKISCAFASFSTSHPTSCSA